MNILVKSLLLLLLNTATATSPSGLLVNHRRHPAIGISPSKLHLLRMAMQESTLKKIPAPLLPQQLLFENDVDSAIIFPPSTIIPPPYFSSTKMNKKGEKILSDMIYLLIMYLQHSNIRVLKL